MTNVGVEDWMSPLGGGKLVLATIPHQVPSAVYIDFMVQV